MNAVDCWPGAPVTRVDLTEPLFRDAHAGPWEILAPGHAIARDLSFTPSLRAAALGPLLPGPAVLADDSAVWVHTGRWVTSPLIRALPHCAPLPGKSTRWTTDRRLLKADDVVILGGYPVTTPARTAADLLAVRPLESAAVGVRALMIAGLSHKEVSRRLGSFFRSRSSGPMRELSRQIELQLRR